MTTGLLRTLIVAALAVAAVAGAWADDYRLGPQDQLQIRVFDLRTGTGEAYRWTAFDGDFTYRISAAGAIAVPLLGQIQAAGQTVPDLARTIGEKLQVKAGLATRPDASIQIVKYRPFYVDGLVQKPGDYEFRPDLTVLQAVSMAGGLLHDATDAMTGLKREELTTRGDLAVLFADRLAFTARQARLDAEIAGKDGIAWPADLTALARDVDAARIMREEQMMFESRRESLRSQINVLNSAKTVLQQQLQSLDEKKAEIAHQLDLSNKELEQVSALVSKGLVVAPRQLAAEQVVAQYQTSTLDIQMEHLRAQQDISKADQDILTLTGTRRNDSLQEATEVHTRLTETEKKIATAQALLFENEVRAPIALQTQSDAAQSPDYFIIRSVDGRSQTIKAVDTDAVQPGDMIRVLPKPMPANESSIAGGQGEAPPAALN